MSLTLFAALVVFSFFVNPNSENLTMNLPVALELNGPLRGVSDSMQRTSASRSSAALCDFRFGRAPLLRQHAPDRASLHLSALGADQLRHVFGSLSRGLLFDPENARRLRWVGLTVVFGELGRAALVYFWSYYTSLYFTANGMRFVASTDLSGTTIIAGLAILVVAEVFREGTRLHEEQSLTI